MKDLDEAVVADWAVVDNTENSPLLYAVEKQQLNIENEMFCLSSCCTFLVLLFG